MKPLLAIVLLLLGSMTLAQNKAPHGKPVTQVELTALLATGSTSERIAAHVKDLGIDFTAAEPFLKPLQDDGAEDSLLAALKSAEVKREEPKDPEASIKDSEALAHLHRAAQLNRNNFHPREAEPEFRAAAAADPANPFVHVALGEILGRMGKDDEAIAEIRAALNLQPDLAVAHLDLGRFLLKNPTQHGEAQEHLRQAVTLALSDPVAHYSYADALGVNGDKQGAAEQRKIASGLGGSFVPKRIWVGGQVMQAKLTSQTRPKYPKEAKADHIEGVVKMDMLVGKDGAVKDLALISGDPVLSAAAMKAVENWRYQPTLLNGQAVEVVTEVYVNFNLN